MSDYDKIAKEYDMRAEKCAEEQAAILLPFVKAITSAFPNEKDWHVLDVGCGAGISLYALHRYGLKTTGIDTSEEMIKYSKKRSPNSTLYFTSLQDYVPDKLYHGIVCHAFIHLFPKKEATGVMKKINHITCINGLCSLTTTLENISSEGYEEKSDYHNSIKRYRARYTQKEFNDFVTRNCEGWNVMELTTVNLPEEMSYGKTWLWAVLTKKEERAERVKRYETTPWRN